MASYMAVSESEDAGGGDEGDKESIGNPEDGAAVQCVLMGGADAAEGLFQDWEALAGTVGLGAVFSDSISARLTASPVTLGFVGVW